MSALRKARASGPHPRGADGKRTLRAEQRPLIEALRPPPREVLQAPFDFSQVDELRALLDAEQFRRLFALLSHELRARPAAIRQALLAGDMDRARTEVHSLKGAALNVGAILVGEAAMTVERIVTPPRTPGGDAACVLDQLDRLSTITLAALDTLAGSAPPTSRRSA